MKPSALVKALGELHTAASPRELIHWALNDLGARIGCDFAVWTQLSPRGELRSAALANGIDAGAYRYQTAIDAHLVRDHPVLRAYLATSGGRQSGRLTDFVSQAAFDATGLCCDAYRHLRMRRQLAMIFQAPDGGLGTFSFGRSGSDFTAEQSRAASELTLHFQLGLGRLWHIEALESETRNSLAARFRAMRMSGVWYYSFVDEPTSNLVLRHFGGAKFLAVPPELARHFSAATIAPQCVTDTAGSRWTLTVSNQNDDEATVTLRLDQPSPHSCASLTRRESEILHWIAQGKRDAEIAAILGISPRTVSKHVEHILAKLGVETRASAAALATRQR